MSPSVFYSPPPFVHHFNNPFATSSFVSQTHRTSLFAFSPQTPSPLRTSKNVNIMGTRSIDGTSGPEDVENSTKPFAQGNSATPMSSSTLLISNTDSGHQLETRSTTVTPAAAQLFTPTSLGTSSNPLAASASSSDDRSVKASQFQLRARQSSPSAQLSSHLRDHRNGRKRVFLNRLRNKRDDERDERGEQQILKSEYMRQRRSWEDFKRREQAEQPEPDEFDLETEMQMMDEMVMEDAPSPTEEREIEALASYYYGDQHSGNRQESRRFDEDDFIDDDDNAYDEAFLEMLSQEQVEQLSNLPQPQAPFTNASRMPLWRLQEQQREVQGGESGPSRFAPDLDHEMS